MKDMQFVEFGSDSSLYEEVMELRYQTFFKEFELPKSVTPDELEPESIHLALLNDNELLAYGRLSLLHQGVYRISQVIVPEPHRGNGYAMALLNEMVERSRELGASRVDLNAQLSAQKFYERCGFVAIDEPYEVKITGVVHVKMVALLSTR